MTDSATAATEVVAQVNRLIVRGDWAVAFVSCTDNARVTKITGTALVQGGVRENARYRFTGQFKASPKHGESFEAAVVLPDLGENARSLGAYMAREFKGCGKVTADKVIKWYQANYSLARLRTILTEAPWDLAECPVIRGNFRASVEGSRDRAGELAAKRLFAVRLSGVPALPQSLVSRLADHSLTRLDPASLNHPDANSVANKAWAAFAREPYTPIRDITGYSFGFADRIGLGLGVDPDHPARLGALGDHVLLTACEQDGHSYLTESEFRARLNVYEGKQGRRADYERIAQCINEYRFPVKIENLSDGSTRIYPAALLGAENRISKHWTAMLQGANPLMMRTEAERRIAVAAGEVGIALDREQHEALIGMLISPARLHTLTAGPGCGKTACMEVFAKACVGRRVAFAAPTGKAAKVLSSRVSRHGFQASTIHRLLEPEVDETGAVVFARHIDNPLEYDIIVIDESSMLELILTRKLFDAVPKTAHVIMLGDTDQLPSVGPGSVLRDLIQIPADHHRLFNVHRNEGGILDLVREVRAGRFPAMPPGQDVVLGGDPGRADTGFGYVCRTYDNSGQTILSEELIAGPVMNAYLDALTRHSIEDVGLLIPRRTGTADEPRWNITYANALLQRRLNPNGAAVGRSDLRVGDRVIVRRNMMLAKEGSEDEQEFVVNGDTGTLESWVPKAGGDIESLQLRLDDGRRVNIPASFQKSVQLGYALTVHASQGSEFAEVIVVGNEAMPMFANRSLLYTAVSRAKRRLVVFGDHRRLASSARTPASARNSTISVRVEARLPRH